METKFFFGSLKFLALEFLSCFSYRTKLFQIQTRENLGENEFILRAPPRCMAGAFSEIQCIIRPDIDSFSQWKKSASQKNLLPSIQRLLHKNYSVHLGFDHYAYNDVCQLIDVYIEGHEFQILGTAFHLGIQFSLDDDRTSSLDKFSSCSSWRALEAA